MADVFQKTSMEISVLRFIFVVEFGGERSLKGGQQNEFLMVKPSEEVFRTGRIFSGFSSTLRNWKILWNQIYLLETLQVFHIECEDVNELVSDQCLLAYTASSTSLTLKV